MLQVAKPKSKIMSVPLLHRQLHEQLSQFIHPQDKRHLEVLAENLAAILLSESGWETVLNFV